MDTRIRENLDNVKNDYIAPFIWLHNEDDEEFINTIDRIQENGINTICIESRTHEEFCREDWWSDVAVILEECKKRDMRVWILDDKHYPSGYANDIFADKYKDLRPYAITEYHIDVAGPVVNGSLMADCWLDCLFYYKNPFRPNDPGEGSIVSVVALKHIPDTDRYSEVIDITDGLSDGMVYFDLPEGTWRIVFVVKTRCGFTERTVSYCDVLNPECIDLYIQEVHQAHYDRFAKYFGNTFLGFFADEPCFQNNSRNNFYADIGQPFVHHPWNDCLRDMTDIKNLAGLWFDIENVSEKVRYSFMDTVSKLYKKNFCDKIGDWCREHDVMYIGHTIEDNNIHAQTGKGTGHFFRGQNGQDMSGVDVVLHQIVPGLNRCDNTGYVVYEHMNSKFFEYYLAKLGASLAHIDPRKKDRALCEIFGAYGWAEGTKIMKYLMDHMLVRGINYFVPHAFSPKDDDRETPPNFYDGGKNPEYVYFKNNMDYLNRMCHMLSDGEHVSTCAILYDAENRWINKAFLPVENIAGVLCDNQLDYDIIPADYLDKIENSSLNGEKYNILIVPYSESIPQDIIQKLKNADIKVVAVSEKENESIAEFENISLNNLAEYMRQNDFADITCSCKNKFLRYYHYTRSGAHIYMFVNEDINNTVNSKITLSAFDGGEYIEYDGFENKAVIKNASSSTVDLILEPYHSVMIVFGDTDKNGIDRYVEKHYSDAVEIKPEFEISLMSRDESQFELYKTTKELINITGRGEKPYFSGYIKYEGETELKKTDCILDLGYVGEAVQVYLNGKYIGSKQIPPYRFEISKDDISDINKLTIVVSNHNGYALRDEFSKYLLFEASGLMGPITICEKEE